MLLPTQKSTSHLLLRGKVNSKVIFLGLKHRFMKARGGNYKVKMQAVSLSYQVSWMSVSWPKFHQKWQHCTQTLTLI